MHWRKTNRIIIMRNTLIIVLEKFRTSVFLYDLAHARRRDPCLRLQNFENNQHVSVFFRDIFLLVLTCLPRNNRKC